MTLRREGAGFVIGALVTLIAVAGREQSTSHAQPAGNPSRTRFEFQVIESFNAKYLGDTPGHVGRGGKLVGKPEISLGDPVFRGKSKVGTVTGLTWDRTKESLEVEFDPEPFEVDTNGRPVRTVRIVIGDDVWIPLGGEEDPRKNPGS